MRGFGSAAGGTLGCVGLDLRRKRGVNLAVSSLIILPSVTAESSKKVGKTVSGGMTGC